MAISERMAFLKGLKLQPYQIAIIVIVATVLLVAAWWYFLFQPTKERIGQLKTDIQVLEDKIVQAKRIEKQLPALRAEVDELDIERVEFLSELPKENEIAQLIDRLRISSDNANVTLNQINNNGSPRQIVPKVREFNFNVNTEGAYFETINFLTELESFRRFTKIKEVNFSIQNAESEDPLLNTNYGFTVYTFTGNDPGPRKVQ